MPLKKPGSSVLPDIHNGLQDFGVAGTTAKIAHECPANLLFAGSRVFVKKPLGREDHPRRTKAALDGALFQKGLLYGVQCVPIREPFNREDILALDSHRQDEAGIHGPPVDEDRTGPAFSPTAPFLDSCQIKSVTQHLEQGLPGFHFKGK